MSNEEYKKVVDLQLRMLKDDMEEFKESISVLRIQQLDFIDKRHEQDLRMARMDSNIEKLVETTNRWQGIITRVLGALAVAVVIGGLTTYLGN